MATYLDEIVASHRRRVAADRRSTEEIARSASEVPAPRNFLQAISRCGDGTIAVIAEVKRRSPSRGDLAPDLDPAALARSYARGGAVALSVLTDEVYFGGSPADLRAARDAVGLPVLRKDFTVCVADVLDARAMGADAVLLIVAVLDDEELAELLRVATDLGMAALVEVHDEAELDRALRADATLVGVNQRDLRSFVVDPDRAIRLAREIPAGVAKVAESGVRSAGDLTRLCAAGFDAALVGEALVTAADPEGALRALSAGLVVA